jgi:hypothetical protein
MRFPTHTSQPVAEHSDACLSSQLHGETKIGESWSRWAWAQSKTLSQNNQCKLAKEVEHISSKHKALSSSPSIAKKKFFFRIQTGRKALEDKQPIFIQQKVSREKRDLREILSMELGSPS